MPSVIIIGFSYRNLLSTITDIYYAYSYYQRLNYQIHICSDIIEQLNIINYLPLISSKMVNQQFIPFVQNIFYQRRTLVIDKDSLLSWFKSINITDDHKLVVYYTGHGIEKHIVLPDNTNFSAIEFRSAILNLNDKLQYDRSANILVIIDCCNPHGLFLPFKFNRDTHVFEHNNNNFILPKMIVITSSEPDSLSQATRLESPFTRYFFNHIGDQTNSYDLKTICSQIDHNIMSYQDIQSDQKCTVYASYPSLLLIWPWTIHLNKLNLGFNYFLDSLMIS